LILYELKIITTGGYAQVFVCKISENQTSHLKTTDPPLSCEILSRKSEEKLV